MSKKISTSENLKEAVMVYLKNSNETARSLSDKTNLSESSIENWKNGRTMISLESAVVFASAIGIDFDLSNKS